MKSLKIKLIFLLAIVVFTHCFKEDIKLEPKNSPINPITDTNNIPTKVVIELTQTYKYQVYYSFNSKSILSTNNKDDWDLAFECNSGSHIIINTSRLMKAAYSGLNDFSSVSSSVGLKYIFDMSSGTLDSSALSISGYSASDPDYAQRVYVIDLGLSDDSKQLGYKKLTVNSVINNKYNIRYANLDGTDEHYFEIAKDTNFNFRHFSFSAGGRLLNIEPVKTSWDLVFTQYTTYLSMYGLTNAVYLVTGALINPYKVTAAKLTKRKFEDVNFDDISVYAFKTQQDVIGFNWKDYNRTTGIYSIVKDLAYIVKDSQGDCYKLHFTNFFNDKGEKGYPTFEFVELRK